jgi:TPR repeat protein
VVKDDKEAFKWFRIAAEQHSYPEAMHNLASMVSYGWLYQR